MSGTQLSTDEWEQLWTAFGRAVELPPSEREQALSSTEEGAVLSPKVQAELEAMLAAHDEEQSLSIERELHRGDRDGDLPRGESLSGTPMSGTLGTYRLLERLGQGGMGEVYLAERRDGRFEQRVAIKLLRPALALPDMLERFDRERDVLGRLDHPAIVPLLDAGTTDSGRPFLVLRHVDGQPITDFCTQQAFDQRRRVELFLDLCRVVQYAHSKLVVHRDLKPSNVLVTGDGSLQLVDFGIAKLIDPDDDSDLTGMARAPMTRRRAAPEQRLAEDITTATDVWALGVLLHELLVGSLPADLHTEPTASNTLDADLEAIVGLCLRREPARRYSSPQHLADDLQRYLDRQPVLARAPRVRYRLQRFVRRHRVPVALASLLVLSLAAFAVAAAVGAARLAQQRDMAESERSKANTVLQLLVDLLGETDPNAGPPGPTIEIARLIERAEESSHELGGQPLVQARLQLTIGQVLFARGNHDSAVELFRSARATYLEELGPNDPRTVEAGLRAASLRHRVDGDVEGARSELREVIATVRPMEDEHPILAADAYRSLGSLMATPEGESLIAEAVAIYREQGSSARRSLAAALTNLSTIRSMIGRRREAREALDEAVAIYEPLLGPDSPRLLGLRSSQNEFLEDPRQRLEAHEALLPRRQAVMGEDHPGVGNSWRLLGLAALEAGDPTRAIEALERALEIWSAVGADHPMAQRIQSELSETRSAAESLGPD